MDWNVVFCDGFDAEFQRLPGPLQDEILAHAFLLKEFGPNVGRPTVDTLKGSKYPNMKELRLAWEGQVWRIAFAFDPRRQAILLVGGDKAGMAQKRFYRWLITLADKRYADHLAALKND